MEMEVNSYHHQGVKRLAARFVPMAYSDDGLIEGFYDPECYDPEEGKFIVGLQFHPERMRRPESDDFDYPGCPLPYQEFVQAVKAYQKKKGSIGRNPRLEFSPLLESKWEEEELMGFKGRSFDLLRTLEEEELSKNWNSRKETEKFERGDLGTGNLRG
ncbi:uncharacterized protein A4U43_C01F31510 [Asparagus officinalis]|uniref:Glutamine amidotransferase domain-containing protein n=1 Tax=Asparagus officinalis TaxID=4686 RepID=A0A5P1FVB8_ASPOF|nr:uncharacterized protein A4U43_C01F31510 [Asparagus officinalis]